MSEGQREGWEHCFKEHVLHEKQKCLKVNLD